MSEQNQPSTEPNITPEVEHAPASDEKSKEVVIISKVTFNYILIAITFFAVGIAVGVIGLAPMQQEIKFTVDETQLREVITSTLREANIGAAAADDSSDRFDLVDDDPYIGDEDAPVVIVEFSDFFCSFCKRHFDQTFVPILENYGQYIRYVYRDFAQLTPESQPAAIASECADEQGKFWEFRDEFFTHQQDLGYDFYIQTAEAYDLDVEAFTTCIDERRYQDEVEIDMLDGQLEGVRGTPGFFVNGQFISGAQPYPIFERIIQRELVAAGINYREGASDDNSDDGA